MGVEEGPFYMMRMTCGRGMTVKNDKSSKKKSTFKTRPSDGENQDWKGIVNNMRENDLLLLSEQEIQNPYQMFNADNKKYKDFISGIRPDKGMILCVVGKKNSRNDLIVPLKASSFEHFKIESHIKYMKEKKKNYHCYYINSLSTIIREYKALYGIQAS